MADTGPGSRGLISCIMCKNETPDDFLRKHITFHHMIQEPDVVEKIYRMHFPSKEMEVQTSVSWINDMIELEESIDNIEASLESFNNSPSSENEEPFSYGIIVDETEAEPTGDGLPKVVLEVESEGSESQTELDDTNQWEEMDLASLMYRYRCPYCDTFGNSDVVLDHILLDHSIPSTSRTYPRYRKPKKQQMAVKIDKRDLTENIDDNEDRPNHCWLPCDATLPEGWKYSESGKNSRSYLSPTGEFLESRDQIIEYLLGLGLDLFHPSGQERITPSSVDCDGLCEGACDNFKIRKIFYEEGDRNMRRKTTKIIYPDETSVSIIKDDVRTDTNRFIDEVKPICYRPPAMKGQRPWIICIEDNKTKKDNVIISLESHTTNLEVSEQSSSVSSRESTPSGSSSSVRKRKKHGGTPTRISKRRKSSSRESTPRPSRNNCKTEKEQTVYDGIYVQCCKKKCQKWRLVTEFADASLVPEYWICSMNRDKTNSVCGLGGNSFNSASLDIEIKFSCGSLVWAKLKGFPWWPGMIDSCPDSDDFYWVDESICRQEPTWYHVVYFEGRGTEVSRAWIRAEDIVSLTSPIRQPKGDTATRPGPLKQRLKNAIELAETAKSHPRKVRLEKFSFSALFEKKSSKKAKKPSRSVDADQNHKAVPTYQKKKDKERMKMDRQVKQREEKNGEKRSFITGPIFSDEEEEEVEREGGGDDLLSQILKKYSVCEDENKETMNHDEDHLSSTGSDEEKEEASLEETLLDEYSSHQVSEFLDIKPEKIDSLDPPMTESPQSNGVSGNCMTEVFIKPEELISNLNPNLDRDFAKPPLPSDVLIALAVRNLDPNNEHGVTFSNIVAFLALHFPYYNRNQEECKEMIKTAYDNSEKIEKENFRIKSSLVPHLLVRIKKFVTKNNLLIKESMLLAEFLDSMLERFQGGSKCEAISYRPPYSCKNLSHLAFITLCPPTSIEQVMIFLKFLFPSLDQSNTFVEKDFEDWIRNDDQIQEYLSPGGDTMYLLQEGVYPVVQHQVRQFFSTKSNFARLKKSIFNPKFVNILLPNLHCPDKI